jgi:hypothetical protein
MRAARSRSNSTDGNLAFGTSAGTDCTTPGVGGAGNTHASRSGMYHLTRINRKGASFFPANAWLASKVTANMNINLTCNAFWNGSTVNFYRSGGGCSNTGEIAAVFLHEWGHGMDTNTGGAAASDQGSGEAVGDTFAFLETRDGCIGQNFLPGSNCHNCVACTGVRDVSDFDISGPGLIARPSNVTANTGINCDRFLTTGGAVNCPYRTSGGAGSLYRGPMGYEGHCESVIAGSANWDLAQMLITQHGVEPGWAAMDKIWYGSLTPSKSAYQVTSGGTCNASASVDGCAATNWYTVFLPADDDDGNLANGTPNACRIWDAFSAHGIACGARPVCSTTCATPATADAGIDFPMCLGPSAIIGTPALPGHTYSWSPGGETTAQPFVTPTATTTYTVTATTACDQKSDSVTITILGPQATANAGDDVPICRGSGVILGTPALPVHTYSWSPGGATTAQPFVTPTETTTYTVTATTGCNQANDSVTITVLGPLPTANAGNDVSICEGQSTTIGTPALAEHSYSWSPGGATTAQVQVSPSVDTTYTVTATTTCTSADDSVSVLSTTCRQRLAHRPRRRRGRPRSARPAHLDRRAGFVHLSRRDRHRQQLRQRRPIAERRRDHRHLRRLRADRVLLARHPHRRLRRRQRLGDLLLNRRQPDLPRRLRNGRHHRLVGDRAVSSGALRQRPEADLLVAVEAVAAAEGGAGRFEAVAADGAGDLEGDEEEDECRRQRAAARAAEETALIFG